MHKAFGFHFNGILKWTQLWVSHFHTLLLQGILTWLSQFESS